MWVNDWLQVTQTEVARWLKDRERSRHKQLHHAVDQPTTRAHTPPFQSSAGKRQEGGSPNLVESRRKMMMKCKARSAMDEESARGLVCFVSTLWFFRSLIPNKCSSTNGSSRRTRLRWSQSSLDDMVVLMPEPNWPLPMLPLYTGATAGGAAPLGNYTTSYCRQRPKILMMSPHLKQPFTHNLLLVMCTFKTSEQLHVLLPRYTLGP